MSGKPPGQIWGVALLGIALVALSFAGVAVAADSQVAIVSVSVSDETVRPGEEFTATATIRNAQSSPSPATITEVGIRGEGVLETQDDLGTLGAGESIQVPISLSLSEPGNRRLTYFLHGRDDSGSPFYVQYPVYVSVEESVDDVGLSLVTPDLIAGDESTVNVTVSNGGSTAISSLELRIRGDSMVAESGRRLSPTLEAGGERTFSFDVRFAEAGPRSLTATLGYDTSEGDERSVSEETTVSVDRLNVDGEIAARVEQNGTDRTIVATIENFGNVPLEDVVVSVSRDGARLDRVQGPDVAPGESGRVAVDASDFPAATLEVAAAYEAAGQSESIATSVRFAPAVESRIELTGVDVASLDDRLTITGDAANVGEADADAVLLRVVETDRITPVNPSKEYFIGTIDSSEFATFELTASVERGTTRVPVEIQYTVDGNRQSRVVDLDVGGTSTNAERGADGESAGGPPVVLVAGVVLAVVLAAAYWWRRVR